MASSTTSTTGRLYVSLQENNAIMEFDMATRQYSRLMPLGWKKLGLISGDYSDKDAEVPPFHSHACSGLVIVGPVRPGLGAPGVPLHHSPCLGHDRIPGRSWLPLRMTGRSRRGPAESAAFWVSWPSHRDCPILSWPTPLSVPSAPVRPFLLVVCPSPLAPAQNRQQVPSRLMWHARSNPHMRPWHKVGRRTPLGHHPPGGERLPQCRRW